MKLVEQFHLEPSLIEEIEVFSPPSKYFQDNISDLSPEETQTLVNLLNKYFLKTKLREESLEYMQQQYEMAQRKYVDLFYFSPTGYFILDRDGQILESNLTATNLLGYPNSAIVGKRINNFLPPTDGQILKNHLKLLFNGERKTICEVSLIHKNLNQRDVQLECILWPDEMGELSRIRTAVIDISERKSLESQVASQAKMEAIDSLVGSIAHDFNNILHSIISNTEYLVHGEELSEDVDNHLKRILDLSSRAAESITQLLEIGSQAATQKIYIEGQNFIEKIKPTLEAFIPDLVDVEWRLQDESLSLNLDIEQIQIILINVIMNSVNAMPKEGALTIDLYRERPSSINKKKFPASPTGDWLVVRVTDNGIGMSPEKLSKLFDPNFDIDKSGKRRRLNLLRARGIMNQHDGHIEVDSTLNVGTSVRLYFPAHELVQPNYLPPSQGEKHNRFDGRGMTLLLVEDEISVGESFREILEFLGFKVIMANNGKNGLDLFNEFSCEIDLIITDLLMPEMDGETFLKTIREMNSEVKIIVASGNPISKKINDLYQWGISGFVQKPFTIQTISTVFNDAFCKFQEVS